MNGDCASRASRRAISVLPTPVGPIIRMFFGVTSSAMSGASRCRRTRLRSAMATARLALAWPMTNLSSSATICRGVSESTDDAVRSGRKMGTPSQLLDREVSIGVDADVAGNPHRLFDDLARVEGAVLRERPCRGQRVGAAGADGDDAVV